MFMALFLCHPMDIPNRSSWRLSNIARNSLPLLSQGSCLAWMLEVFLRSRIVSLFRYVLTRNISFCTKFAIWKLFQSLFSKTATYLCYAIYKIREEDEEIEAEGANYQLEMMRCLREVNVDNNTVGWLVLSNLLASMFNLQSYWFFHMKQSTWIECPISLPMHIYIFWCYWWNSSPVCVVGFWKGFCVNRANKSVILISRKY